MYFHTYYFLYNLPFINRSNNIESVSYGTNTNANTNANTNTNTNANANTNTNEIIDINNQLDECPICFENLNIRNKIKLKCNLFVEHYLCKNCYHNIINSTNLICPICRNPIQNIPLRMQILNNNNFHMKTIFKYFCYILSFCILISTICVILYLCLQFY